MSTETEVKDVEVKEQSDEVIDPLVQQLNNMAQLLDTLSKTSKTLTTEMKSLTKDVNKLRVSKTKKTKTKRVIDPDVPRKLGALERPVPITDELATFLGLTVGEMYSRQSITQGINAYVKAKDLQNPENRRYILLDTCDEGRALGKLLREPDQPLTFFNIQRYLKVHYPKVEQGEDSTNKSVVDSVPEPKEVVKDTSIVDETPVEVVKKKKVIRRVVKKSSE